MITSVSPVTRRYVREFFLRLAVFGLVLLTWVFAPERLTFTAPFQWSRWPLAVLWVAVFVSMAAQLDPNSRLTAGCMKQYPARFDPVPGYDPAALSLAVRRQNRGAVKVALVWLAVNLVIGALYHRNVLSAADLIALCALAYLCDLVCVLFFCPFQTFLMGNRCCVSCRIFAWGSWMMAAPLMCVPHWYSWSLFGMGLAVLAVWERRYARYPERFWEGSNRLLQCAHCQEQLCRYKFPRSPKFR